MKKLQVFSTVLRVSGMKKCMIALLVGAIVAQSVSAFDFNWGAWGRAGWAPLIVEGGQAYKDDGTADGTDTSTYLWSGSGPGWDSIGAAVGFELNGQNEPGTIGFVGKLRYDVGANTWYANDNTANAWVKPIDMLTIRMGLYQVDDLRGKIGGLNQNFVFGGKTGDEDTLFMRFESKEFGAHFKLVPIEALQIHASFGTNNKYGEAFNGGGTQDYIDGVDAHGDPIIKTRTTGFKEDSNAILDIFSTAQYGIGYTISNIGFARVQFIGGTYGKNIWQNSTTNFVGKANDYNQIQFAFQLTAVENLNLDFGVKIPFAITPVKRYEYVIPYSISNVGTLISTDDSYQAPIVIALGAKYTMGDLGILFRLDTYLAEAAKSKDRFEWTGPFKLNFSIEPSYKIGDIGTIYADVSLGIAGNSEYKPNGQDAIDKKDGKIDLGLGLSFYKSLGAGATFNIGVASIIPVAGDGYDGDDNKVDKARAFKLGIPIVMTYSLY